MRKCDYDTEAGTVQAECGTLVVPENRRNPASQLISLPLVRIVAATRQPREPVFRLGGGPDETNMTFPQSSRLTADHDVVLVGYRGVDGSRRLDCPEVTGALQANGDLTGSKSQKVTALAFKACAMRLTKHGVDLTAYSVAQRVDDIEAARTALGYPKIDLLSSSAGTRTAMVYSWRHPASLFRSAMVSVNPPGHMVWDPEITDRQLTRYAQLCAADTRCSSRTDDLVASMRKVTKGMPKRWGPFTIDPGTVRTVSMYSMHLNGRSSAPVNAPTAIDAYLSGTSSLWAMSVLGALQLPSSIVWGEFASFAMIDAPAAKSFYAAGGGTRSVLNGDATDFLWGGPAGYFTAWPDSPDNAQYRTPQASNVETLLVGGSVDFSTPAELATNELLPLLPNGHQVILPELGHTTDFWEYNPDASRHLLTTFYDSGQVDDSQFGTRPVNFDPGPLTMSDLATVLVCVPLGGALIALILLTAMTRRVRRFGPRTGAWLRVLTPIPLGLGGWFLAVLLVWTLGLTVFILGTALVVPAVGLAVGLGTYAAWTRPGRPHRTGLTTAVTGAAVGAWSGAAQARRSSPPSPRSPEQPRRPTSPCSSSTPVQADPARRRDPVSPKLRTASSAHRPRLEATSPETPIPSDPIEVASFFSPTRGWSRVRGGSLPDPCDTTRLLH